MAQNMNSVPNQSIGNMLPIDIVSPVQDVVIIDKMNGWKSKQPPYEEMIKNQENYESKKGAIQAGQFVYARTKEWNVQNCSKLMTLSSYAC